MPTTVATVLVLLIAIVPGAVGNFAYRRIAGIDWREKEWQAANRYLAFSVIGLAIYSVLANVFDFAPAIHVIPSTYEAASLKEGVLARVLVPYLGHLGLSGAVGAAAAGFAKVFARWTRNNVRPCAWDHFASDLVSGRWVVLTLKSGDVYAGIIQVADTGVAGTERDIVLGEPARLDAQSGVFIATPYQSIFLPAELIQSVGALTEKSLDKERLTEPGKPIFGASSHARFAKATANTSSAVGSIPEGGQHPSSTIGASERANTSPADDATQ